MSLQNSRPPYYVGVDVGGTNIKAGVVDDDGQSLSHVSFATDAARGPEFGLENIARAAEMAIAQSGVPKGALKGVGLATPGTMDIPAGCLIDPPNLPGWINFPIRDRLKSRLQLPTVLQNDANAAAYGEFWAGGAKEARSLVFWTLVPGSAAGSSSIM